MDGEWHCSTRDRSAHHGAVAISYSPVLRWCCWTSSDQHRAVSDKRWGLALATCCEPPSRHHCVYLMNSFPAKCRTAAKLTSEDFHSHRCLFSLTTISTIFSFISWMNLWETPKVKMKKNALREMQTLCTGCSKVEQKIFTPPQTPFPESRDGQNIISWRWSLPLPTNPVWWGSMRAVLSYRGNRPTQTPTNTHTHRQDRLQYTALQLVRSVIIYFQQTRENIQLQYKVQHIKYMPSFFSLTGKYSTD